MKKNIKDLNKLIAEQKQIISEQKKSLQANSKTITELIKRTASDRMILEGSIISNVNMMLIPLIHRLEAKSKASKLVTALRAIIAGLTQPTLLKMNDKKLTKREIEVCSLIKEGFNSPEIAKTLELSKLTVEKHRFNIRKKLDISESGHSLYQILRDRY